MNENLELNHIPIKLYCICIIFRCCIYNNFLDESLKKGKKNGTMISKITQVIWKFSQVNFEVIKDKTIHSQLLCGSVAVCNSAIEVEYFIDKKVLNFIQLSQNATNSS